MMNYYKIIFLFLISINLFLCSCTYSPKYDKVGLAWKPEKKTEEKINTEFEQQQKYKYKITDKPDFSSDSIDEWQPAILNKNKRSANFGNYYAIVIGNNNYIEIQDLLTAENDAIAVSQLLENVYGFKISRLTNATRYDILLALDEIKKNLSSNDNLLIYYAGHGHFDQEAERGYWLPVDANQQTTANWVSNSDITDKLKSIQAKHILVVADSCFSGTLLRGINVALKSSHHLETLSSKRSRTVLTSGGMEPVADSGGGKYSVFANAFLIALQENIEVIDGTELFTKIRKAVMLNADQTPQYGDIRMAGHEGGDFIFVRIN